MPSTLERPPIVTIMGHVDHGKTTLLDAYRSSSIAAGEAGGITQHIGAFMVELGDAQRITFLDTPGHAAFSAMRQRGASATDVVILVVAADDGVMPQTIESIKYATEAGVPLVVAINKCDKEQADVHRVKQELARHGVDLEDFGGAVQAATSSLYWSGLMSSLTKQQIRKNLDALLEAVLLQAEVRGTQGKASNPAEGVVIEASSDKFKGQVATVLLHDGSLKPGEYIAAGCSFARIKSMTDDGKQRLKSLQPSMAAEVMGWRSLPEVGVPVFKVASERRRQMAEEHRQETLQERRRLRRLPRSARPRELNQQELLDVASSDKPTRLLVVRSDVQGSAEALVDAIAAIPSSEVACQVIRQGVGNITDSDIELAATTNATILGFGVGLGKKEAAQAEQQGVQVKLYKVVYHLLEELEQDLLSMLPPLMVEKQVGKAKVLQVFNLTGKRKSTVAGCRVLTGSLVKAHRFKVLRKGEEIHEGELSQLMHHKDSVEEVGLNTECGLSFEDYSDFAADDEVVCYQIEEKRRERL
ncbi:uncharacterized protein MONBRDRAFT_17831 [Monosiga brevicollis MX1]|uniref:Translation initiation factor IF-2, mitochondrial n=1 Tax=Monosiga brevicollis TaxID=81824 RepID=A9URL4_MONBE|nr:uncharacterized protein MONBRDRAFT_17831 [Monosiga brevicollis MX1]EDQ91944.1 predicted protein [Monosiga brevicollis MX1]|eukprot:XP_001743230.1 hypothetical protein [Monosiga brevicollis MX1]